MLLGVINGSDVEVQVTTLGVGDLQISADHRARLSQLIPVNPAHSFGQRLSLDGFWLKSKEVAGGAIHVGDPPLVVQQDDPLLQSLKDLLQHALLPQKLCEKILHLAGFKAIHAFDELVKKA